MNPRDRADEIQKRLLAARSSEELRQNLETLLQLFAESDEISATIEICTDALRRVEELALSPEESLRYSIRLLESLRRRGKIADAVTLADDVLRQVASPSITSETATQALCTLAAVAITAGQYDRGAELLDRAAPHAAASGDVACLAVYHVARGYSLVRMRRSNAAVSAFETAASLYRLLGDPAKEAGCRGQAARAHMFAGRTGIAAELYAEAVEQSGQTLKDWVAIALNYSICLLWRGEWDRVKLLLEKAETQARSIGLFSEESRILTLKAHLALRRSELDEAEALARRAAEIASTNSLIREELAALECLGEVEYERRKPAEALRYYAECIARGEAIGMSDATTEGKRREAEAWNALGEHAKALAAATRCIEVAETNEDRYEHAVAHRPLAIAHSMLGNQEAAERAFRRGIEEIRTLGERFELGKTLVEFACHLREWDANALALGAAGEYLREAREIFVALGAERWVARADEELAAIMQLTEPEPAATPVAVGTIAPVEKGVRTFGSVSIVTRSPEMHRALEQLARVAPSDLPVLITGESGTGKELIARALQELSGRPEERFVAVNCAALPKELHESELFGHAKGAFTGAGAEKPGLFEQADGGTLFLDEIGDLDPGAQGKLLRVLEDGEIRRVGEVKPRHVDARIVAATNRDLEQLGRDGQFRLDLYHRLNGHRVHVPSLRERPGDIEALGAHYVEHYRRQYGKRVQLSSELLSLYKGYSWPGNVRELRQEVHRLVLLTADGGTLRAEDSPIARLASREQSTSLAHTAGYTSSVVEHEKRLIVDALARASGNRSHAARILNMSRTTLLGKIRRLGIE